ncbi:MAG: hypothetical protein K2Q21_10970 [Chitinophagaceae bacterium]|nr:hypothetical protein [Chitinophagaceae bacterium]
MKNWTHDIIEELRDKYSETSTDLTRFFQEKFKIEKTDLVKAKKMKDLLVDFEGKRYITWKVGKMQLDGEGKPSTYEWDEGGITPYRGWKNNFGTNSGKQDETLANNRIEAQLTIDGLDYAIKLKRDKNQFQIFKWTGIATAVFTGIAAIFSIANYFKEVPPINVKGLDTISLRIQQLQSKLQPQTLPLTIAPLSDTGNAKKKQ